MDFRKSLLVLLATAVVLTVYGEESAEVSRVSGVWKTSGYGYVFDINSPDVSIYELTAISCLRSGLESGSIELDPRSDIQGRFHVKIDGYIDAYMEMHETENPDELILHRTDTASLMKAYRLESLPALCNAPVDQSFEYNLSVLLQNYKEHYPFFDIKGTDWEKFSQVELPNSNISELEFFNFLVSLVEPLYDTHVVILVSCNRDFLKGIHLTA